MQKSKEWLRGKSNLRNLTLTSNAFGQNMLVAESTGAIMLIQLKSNKGL